MAASEWQRSFTQPMDRELRGETVAVSPAAALFESGERGLTYVLPLAVRNISSRARRIRCS